MLNSLLLHGIGLHTLTPRP